MAATPDEALIVTAMMEPKANVTLKKCTAAPTAARFGFNPKPIRLWTLLANRFDTKRRLARFYLRINAGINARTRPVNSCQVLFKINHLRRLLPLRRSDLESLGAKTACMRFRAAGILVV